MPNINRIRVNNVKYNFGTQQYDDFVMRMHGKSTLYDLANGGGKSVLMLLLLQTLIPNCTLDEKQPIEKLFRSGCGNTTIHSLVEWKLDRPELHDGYRYMTTGFCARKAKDASDDEVEEGDIASIEYFNYCIFYREYNDHDIVNLPLVKDGERVTYTGLKNDLKELGRKDMRLKVQIFERKGEYQRFISGYGLHESHWEIIRGINKTEGHVRTYFESNYKTARKVVEDLLIEEIIEKAYLVKVEEQDAGEDMAKTLLEIKDKLVELAKKKREITDYDRQSELMHVLEARVASCLDLYEQHRIQCQKLGDICVTAKELVDREEATYSKLQESCDEAKEAMNQRKIIQESLKIKAEVLLRERLTREIQELKQLLAKEEEKLAQELVEVNLKESMNEYMEYLSDRNQCAEQEAILKSYGAQGERQTLQALCQEKKRRDDDDLKQIRQEHVLQEQAEKDAQERISKLQEFLQEAKIQHGIHQGSYQHLQRDLDAKHSQALELRQQLQDISFLTVENIQEENSRRNQEIKIQLESLEGQLALNRENIYQLDGQVKQKEQECQGYHQELQTLKSQENEYLEKASGLKRMLEIYGVLGEERASDWITPEDILRLLEVIQERYLVNVAKIAQLRQQCNQLQQRVTQFREGRVLSPTQAVEKVKYYIESRHGGNAIFGMDYLAARQMDQRQELLTRHPLLPYGLLVENFQELCLDQKLQELNLADGFVLIYDIQALEETYTQENNQGLMWLAKGKEAFCVAENIEKELKNWEEELREHQEELGRLEEIGETYQQDSRFVAGFQGVTVVAVEQQERELEERLRECRQEETELKLQLATKEKDLETLETQYQNLKKEWYGLMEQAGTLDSIIRINQELAALEEEYAKEHEEIKRLEGLLEEYQEELERRRQDFDAASHRREYLDARIQERLQVWEQLYQPYYIEDAVVDGYEELRTLEDHVLDARTKGILAALEETQVNSQDKQRLIQALQASMERTLRNIAKRGVELKVLQDLEATHSLYTVSATELARLNEGIKTGKLRVKEMEQALREKTKEESRLEGSIAQAMMTMEERFGAYQEIDIGTKDIALVIQEGNSILQHLLQEYQELEKKCQAYAKDTQEFMELYKDVKRIVELREISLEQAKLLPLEIKDLQDVFKESLAAYDRYSKALDRGKQELNHYKTQTAQSLMDMQALELAQTVQQDVSIPENYGEAKALRDNLESIIQVINLEKERVQQGIEDMEFVKKNFEHQCIQRCQDVKHELEKLPKLSRIVLEGEPIQMVGLQIGYVKDEFIPKRMSDYIDEVVRGADRYDQPQERMRFIRGKLELKKLFSVIVTDMNNIKLTLYKRERIKEQSRYLRYEEAVGSTGQSQGIYIQFLVSVINYISGIYAPSGEQERLLKTIFIDNPFGAAKDVYIWEPIFALLKANQVQLVVPARGATPAITSRFEVNYTLGQQMVGKRQQTVVVDYRSQTEQEEMEYQELEYEQVSFDFI